MFTYQFICHAGNHRAIITETGYKDLREYRYFKKDTRGLDYEGMVEDLRVSSMSHSVVGYYHCKCCSK